MTKKRLIKLLMGRVKLSRDSARFLCSLKAANKSNVELYNSLAFCIPKLYGAEYIVAHIRRISNGYKFV